MLLKFWQLGFVYMEFIVGIGNPTSLVSFKVKKKKGGGMQYKYAICSPSQKYGHTLAFSLISTVSNSWDWYKDKKLQWNISQLHHHLLLELWLICREWGSSVQTNYCLLKTVKTNKSTESSTAHDATWADKEGNYMQIQRMTVLFHVSGGHVCLLVTNQHISVTAHATFDKFQ